MRSFKLFWELVRMCSNAARAIKPHVFTKWALWNQCRALRHYAFPSAPPPLSECIYVMAHYLIYLFYLCNQKPISSPERSPVCHSARLSVRLSVCSRLLRFGNFQTDLCVGLCSFLQDKSIPQRTQTLKWNPFQVANAGCQDRSVAGGDKAIYGEDRRWEILALAFSPCPCLRSRHCHFI